MTNLRAKWTTPEESELVEELQSFKVFDDKRHLPRLRTIHEEFGPSTDMLFPGGIPAAIALHELKLAYIMCLDISAIMASHIFVEQVLGGSLIMSGYEKEAEGGLSSIIKTLLKHEALNDEVAISLHKLKNIRISYFHAHTGLKERSYMGRWMKSGTKDPYEFVEQDAKICIQAVVDLLRYHNPDRKPI